VRIQGGTRGIIAALRFGRLSPFDGFLIDERRRERHRFNLDQGIPDTPRTRRLAGRIG